MALGGTSMIAFDRIELGPNPRTEFGDIDTLIASIKARGLINPLVVRCIDSHGKGFKDAEGKLLKTSKGEMINRRYILSAGGRRYESIRRIREEAKAGGIKEKDLPHNEVMVRIDNANADETMWTTIGENLGRKDLNPVELADAISERLKSHTMEDVLKETGLKKQRVDKLIEMRTQCSAPVLKAIAKSDIPVSTAIKLVGLSDEQQKALLDLYTTTKATEGRRKATEKVVKATGEFKPLGRKRLNAAMDNVSTYFNIEGDAYWRGAFDAYRDALGMPTTLREKLKERMDDAKGPGKQR